MTTKIETCAVHGGTTWRGGYCDRWPHTWATSILESPPCVKGKPNPITLTCQECGRRWKVSPNAADPRCKCGSVDWEVGDE